MTSASFALIAGLAYLGAGVAGLLPIFLSPPPADAPETQFTFLYGYLFGLFPVNIAHSAVHMVIGLWRLSTAAAAGACTRPDLYFTALLRRRRSPLRISAPMWVAENSMSCPFSL
jgi:hypothetical protein